MNFWVILSRKETNKTNTFGSLCGHWNRFALEAALGGLVSAGEFITYSISRMKTVEPPIA